MSSNDSAAGGRASKGRKGRKGGKTTSAEDERADLMRRAEADLFIDEVTEELQKEQAYKYFRRYGPYVAAVIVAIVAAASFFEFQRAAAIASARESGGALLAAQDAESPAVGFGEAAENLAGPAAAIARLHAGAAHADAGEQAAAAEAFTAAANGFDGAAVYSDLALIRAALAGFDDASPDQLITSLEPLAGQDRPYRPLALELLALAEVRAGRLEAAREYLDEALQEDLTTPEQRRRLSALLEGVGGAPPSEADALGAVN
ncbi:MAG: hypothetical protein AAF909_09365 [Pseudomonadota bacterium]